MTICKKCNKIKRTSQIGCASSNTLNSSIDTSNLSWNKELHYRPMIRDTSLWRKPPQECLCQLCVLNNLQNCENHKIQCRTRIGTDSINA